MQFLRSWDRDYDAHEPHAQTTQAAPAAESSATHQAEETVPGIAAQAEDKPQAARPRLSRKPVHARDRKPAASSKGRVNRGSTRTGDGSRHGSTAHWSHGASSNGHSNNGHNNGHTKQSGSHANGTNDAHKSKPSAARSSRNGHVAAGKSAAKSSARPGSRLTAAARKEVRTDARSRRKPAMSASAKTGNRARYGFSASSGQRAKKRG